MNEYLDKPADLEDFGDCNLDLGDDEDGFFLLFLLLVWTLDRPTGIGGTSLSLSDIVGWLELCSKSTFKRNINLDNWEIIENAYRIVHTFHYLKCNRKLPVDEEVTKKEFECVAWLKDDALGDKGSTAALNSLIFIHRND